jgi:hypothetical protein
MFTCHSEEVTNGKSRRVAGVKNPVDVIHQFFLTIINNVMDRHESFPHKSGISTLQPCLNIATDFFCQKKHFFRFLIGGNTGPLITSYVSFLPELIKLGDKT